MSAHSYNPVLHCYVAKGEVEDCHALYQRMTAAGVAPDLVTFVALFQAVKRRGQARQRMQAHSPEDSYAWHAKIDQIQVCHTTLPSHYLETCSACMQSYTFLLLSEVNNTVCVEQHGAFQELSA